MTRQEERRKHFAAKRARAASGIKQFHALGLTPCTTTKLYIEDSMEKKKVKIVWSGQGGELDSVTVIVNPRAANSDEEVTNALVRLVSGNIVNPGDSFTIEEVA